jgi:hypothetical protein
MNESYWLPAIVIFFIPIVAIIGGISVAIAATISRGRVRELQIRERIAMIEKGLVPPPEVDPEGFDRAMSQHELSAGSGRGVKSGLRRAGVMVMSVGFGLVLLISLWPGGSVRAGIGVGGFVIIVGAAFLVNSLLESQDRHPSAPGPLAPTTPPRE